MCDKPLQSVFGALGGGSVGGAVGLVAGLGLVETAVLAGTVAGLADVGAHLAAGDEAVEPLADLLRVGRG